MSQDKQSLERHNDSLKNKSPQIRRIPHVSFGPSDSKTLFTWSGGPRSSGVGLFCFVSPRAWKQKKPTPLDRGPPLHVNRPLIEQQQKNAGWQNLSKNINKLKKKVLKYVAFLPEGDDWLNVNRPAKKTLVLI